MTVDRNLPAQHKTTALPFGILVLRSPTNQLSDLAPLVPDILAALPGLKAGQVHVLTVGHGESLTAPDSAGGP